MQRLFSAFPDGRPGAALLLLRVVVSLVVFLHTVRGLFDGALLWPTVLEIVAASGAALILVGLVTPFAALCVASALALSQLPTSVEHLGTLKGLLLIADCVALALLGPGAWSVDARLFGRRKILIPTGSNHRPA